MTRKQYLKLRRQNRLSNECLYLYWKAHKKEGYKKHGLVFFAQLMTLWLSKNNISQNTAIEITTFLDKEFKIKKLNNPNGKLIKIW